MNEQLLYNLYGANGHSNVNIDQLRKALEIHPGTAGVNSPAGTIDTWKPEWMSAIQTTLYASEADLKFSRCLFTDPTSNAFYQYRRETVLGKIDIWGSHSGQSEIKEFANPGWDRAGVVLKLHQETAADSFLAQSHQYYSISDLLEYITNRKMLAMLIRENIAYMRGNSLLDPNLPDGIMSLHQKIDGINYSDPTVYANWDHVIDKRGTRLNVDDISHADNVLIRSYDSRLGRALWMPQATIEGLTSQSLNSTVFFRNESAPNENEGGWINNSVAGMTTTAQHKVRFNYDIFIKRHQEWLVNDPSQSIDATAPATPNVSSGTNAAISDPSSRFATADAGTYYYAVAAVGSGGISKLALINATPVTISGANYSVKLKFVDGAGTYPTTGYIIYRGLKNGLATDLMYPIIELSVAQLAAGYETIAGTGCVVDKNHTIPGMQDAIMVSYEPDGVTLAKDVVRRIEMQNNLLNGFVRLTVPIAVTAPLVQAKLLHAHALALPAPTKVIIFRNIKP